MEGERTLQELHECESQDDEWRADSNNDDDDVVQDLAWDPPTKYGHGTGAGRYNRMPEKRRLPLPIAVSRVQVKLTVKYGSYI